MPDNGTWTPEDEIDPDDQPAPTEYDILSSPNDWNVLTIANYMEAGAIQIPYFQRNYVWDLKRASRLIESLIVGLPVPQVFLYEEARNRYLVIDGQQRLLTIYFFIKGRFPKPSRRGQLRQLLQNGGLNEQALADDGLFQDFKLSLSTPETPTNRFHRLKYEQLGEYKPSLDLRSLRNVVVKQVSPRGDSAIYEIFNRLNSGGVNLAPQEIRASLYRSPLMAELGLLNEEIKWRTLIGRPEPDARMQDAEILLRAMALAVNSENYTSPMTSFINAFCISARAFSQDHATVLVNRLREIIATCSAAGPEHFKRGGRFSPLVFEAVVATLWDTPESPVAGASIAGLASDSDFVASLQEGSTKVTNVEKRLAAAQKHLG